MRKRFAITAYALLCISAQAGAQVQEPPPDHAAVVAPSPFAVPTQSAVVGKAAGDKPAWISLSGHVDLHYLHTDGAIEEARSLLNGSAPGFLGDANLLGANVSVRLDAQVDDGVRACLEIERLPYAAGAAQGLGSAGVTPTLDQAYVEFDDVLLERMTLRLGQFDFDYRLRPHGEPFFFDSKAESTWSGSNGTFVRTTADRDLTASAGVRLQYAPVEILLAEFALVVRDKQPLSSPSDDEWAAILYLNAITSERTSLFVLISRISGPGQESALWTLGAGVDAYFGATRAIEAFGELYGQFGDVGPAVRKRALGGQAGVRVSVPRFAAELALAYRSGDKDPGDDRDEAFQSAERVDRFLLVESAEFGFDWDTNMRAVQLGVSYEVATRLTARLDLGWFAFNEPLVDAVGVVLLSDPSDAIGTELDGTLSYAIHAQARAYVRGALLAGSDVLEAFTSDATGSSWLMVAGCDVRF